MRVRCVWALQSLWRFQAVDPNTWTEALSLLPHVEAVAGHAYAHGVCLVEVCALLCDAAMLLSLSQSSFSEAQRLLELSLAILTLERSRLSQAIPSSLKTAEFSPAGDKKTRWCLESLINSSRFTMDEDMDVNEGSETAWPRDR